MQFRTKVGESERLWEVRVDLAALRRVRTLLGINLMQVVNPQDKLLEDIAADPVVLVDILYAVCKPQADACGLSDVAFGEQFSGDTLTEASKALFEGIVDFCPSRPKAALKKAMWRGEKIGEVLLTAMEAEADNPRLDEKLSALTSSTGSSSSSPASAELTPQG